MAKCDQGYICQVCHAEVKGVTQSDLYLRYVIGLVDPETLHLQRERHIKCNPSLAQFIDREEFQSLAVDPAFCKANMDLEYVTRQTELVTRGFQRLQQVAKLDIPITEYPLTEVREKYRSLR